MTSAERIELEAAEWAHKVGKMEQEARQRLAVAQYRAKVTPTPEARQ